MSGGHQLGPAQVRQVEGGCRCWSCVIWVIWVGDVVNSGEVKDAHVDGAWKKRKFLFFCDCADPAHLDLRSCLELIDHVFAAMFAPVLIWCCNREKFKRMILQCNLNCK